MVQAIGSSAAYGAVNSGAAASSLQAQLARYQKQLSECVNCESSRTAEGKAEIQAVSLKISEVRERIDKVTEAKASTRTGTLATSTATEIRTNSKVAAAAGKENGGAGPANRTVGGLVDVFA